MTSEVIFLYCFYSVTASSIRIFSSC